ncbi:FtsX-like permease family protein [Pedobacter sp. HMF7647]|uniref:FtsX-like permease family protein n=1 Tax=Hufsiella arboris TaxID=2695275 RepID=A0A7K1YBI8_9SPHI|nr:ABC transporter permease [Hufsiella arboris]MXV51946.1 FtsX-like permease family protein [Hufsiella arboris]
MIKNYLKTAWRNILTKKSTSFINISGLAVGMAVALLIGLWINNELSFNKYNEHYDHVARVMQSKTISGTINTNENIPVPLAAELRTTYKNNFKNVVLASGTWNHILNSGDKQLLKTGSFMQPEAPELLSLHMIRGTRKGLNDPSSVLLAATTARALYGNVDPTGKMLKLDNKMPVKISGVYDDLPKNSSFNDLAFIAAWQLYYAADPNLKKADTDWGNNSYLLYVRLNDNADVNTVSSQIKDAKLHRVDQGSAKFKPVILLQPMSRWHLYAEYKNGVNTGGQITYIWLFGLIGVFVLLLACINFMNLSTARSEKRAREVGVRKAVGSLRSQLIMQFFTESIAVSLLSFLFAIVFAWLALPLFNEVAGKQINIPWGNPLFWLLCLSFSTFAGLLAGTYPALYLSSFNPVKVLKGAVKVGRFSKLPRQMLVVMQFAVSIILIIGTVIIFKQIHYSQNRAVGYNRNGLITIEVNSGTIHKQFEAFRNDLINSGAIVNITESSSSTTGIFGGVGGLKWSGKDPQMNDEFGMVGVNTSYGETVGWQLTQGRDFAASAADSSSVILNEAAVTYMGLKHPVGETIDWWGKKYQVAGVIKNMVMSSPYEPAKQTIFLMDTKPGNFLIIRINPRLSANTAINKIQGIWKQYAPAEPLDFRFADQEYQKKFADEQKIGTLAGIFSVLAIFISCMGIFGMAIFVAEQRIKEIGVRKILGASTFNLWRMLSMDFVVLVVISLIIASPIAWYLMYNWVGRYVYHTELSWWIFAITGVGTIVITLLTVSYQSLKAAIMNPVKSLKAD